MPIEILVAALCVGQYECNTALKAYYNQNNALKQLVKEKKKEVVDVVGEKTAYAIPALMVMASGGSAQIKISRQFSCGGGDDKVLCMFNKSF